MKKIAVCLLIISLFLTVLPTAGAELVVDRVLCQRGSHGAFGVEQAVNGYEIVSYSELVPIQAFAEQIHYSCEHVTEFHESEREPSPGIPYLWNEEFYAEAY